MLLALLGACAPADRSTAGDFTDCDAGEPSAVIGTGEYAWEDLAPGGEITMVHGPQGGWHILGSVRIARMYSEVVIRYTITDVPSGQLVSDNDYFVEQVPLGDCDGEVIGRYGYLSGTDELADGEADTPWEVLACHELTLAMTVDDPTSGKSVVASKAAIAVPDAADSTVPCP